MRRKKTDRFELGNATVFVTRASLDLDKMRQGYYRCDVHPVGGKIFRCWLRSISREEAAKAALLRYEETR